VFLPGNTERILAASTTVCTLCKLGIQCRQARSPLLQDKAKQRLSAAKAELDARAAKEQELLAKLAEMEKKAQVMSLDDLLIAVLMSLVWPEAVCLKEVN
jgi:hypothetical protein